MAIAGDPNIQPFTWLSSCDRRRCRIRSTAPSVRAPGRGVTRVLPQAQFVEVWSLTECGADAWDRRMWRSLLGARRQCDLVLVTAGQDAALHLVSATLG